MKNQDKDTNETGNLLFVGFMFIGMGIGFAFDNVAVGTFIGMGGGFIAYAIYGSEKNNTKTEK
jgi:hypothetical protein